VFWIVDAQPKILVMVAPTTQFPTHENAMHTYQNTMIFCFLGSMVHAIFCDVYLTIHQLHLNWHHADMYKVLLRRRMYARDTIFRQIFDKDMSLRLKFRKADMKLHEL